MRFSLGVLTAVFVLPLVLGGSLLGAERVPWTTSHIHGSPEPPKSFVAARVFPGAEFNKPTEIVYDPVGHCWLVLEQAGRLLSLAKDKPELCADLKALHEKLNYLYGLALHPHYAENGLVYITYTLGDGVDDGTKLSRFTMRHDPVTGTPKLDTASEQVILTWRSGGHNGANLQFGPDGMLYISTGDSEVPAPPDPRNTGQDISDLLSSILRIDVDHADAGLAYAIPKDNPFIGQMVDTAEHKPKPARGEVWAYGLRNPWKMSFDRKTGRLWCADVGWELWESVDLIEKGGNYGWSAMEASQPVRADAPKGPTPIRPPVVAHSHDEAASITGGYVYHGSKYPELEGAYLYGDWATGKIWALWHDGKQVTRHEEIADTHLKIVAFGQDAAGEIVFLDYNEKAGMYALERNKAEKTEKFPVKLSETGLFSSMEGYFSKRETGTLEFSIRAPLWYGDNNSRAHYQLALPGNSKIATKVIKQKDKDGKEQTSYELIWPKDAVLSKTIHVHMDMKAPPRVIETQILHYDGSAWNAYSYRWNDEGTDATLVPASGDTRDYRDQEHRKQEWRFHSRAECMRCHNSWVGYTLAFKPEQLDRRLTPDPSKPVSFEMQGLAAHGVVDDAFPKQGPFVLVNPFLDRGTDDREAEWKARSFLHANCAHCHRQNAGGAVNMMLNADLPLEKMMVRNVTPQQGGLGLINPKLADPGNPWNSAICVRLATGGTGHMPLIGHGMGVFGLNLIEDWVVNMDKPAFEKRRCKVWTQTVVREKLQTVEGAMETLRAVDDEVIKDDLRKLTLELAWKSPQQTVRDLFERFKPEDQREKTLGTQVDVAALLAMKGDAGRGAQVLSLQGKLGACYACHFVNGTGRDFGPDLSHVGTRLTKAQILESVLMPSKVIAPGFAAVAVELKDGSAQVGFIVKEDADVMSLKIATGQTVPLKKEDVAKRTTLPASLMPEGLLGSLTAQEAADVLAFLTGLK